MKILIFGATGPTGRHLIEQALEQNHEVTAFARTPSKIEITHDNLSIAQGDATDPAAVENAVAGHDAVLCAIGAPGMDTSRIRERATRVILDAMKQTGVRRFICLSSFGVAESRAQLPFMLRFVIVPFFLRHAFADHARQEALVRDSGLDWTLVRPPHLNDGPRTGAYREFTNPKGTALKISRADVADFMLRQLEDPSNIGKHAAISS